jgi:hypothetical protein
MIVDLVSNAITMKVLCVSNIYSEYVGVSVTVGKWYDVSPEPFYSISKYLIKDDSDRWSYLDRKYFRTVEELREEKLKEIGL